MNKIDINKSIEELEGDVWKIFEFPSELVKRCFELRKVPLNSLEIDDLRLLIIQQIGLSYVVPLAIEMLEKDILAEGMYFPGDLLKSILNVPENFWKLNKNYFNQLHAILEKGIDTIENSDTISTSIKASLKEDIEVLKNANFLTS